MFRTGVDYVNDREYVIQVSNWQKIFNSIFLPQKLLFER